MSWRIWTARLIAAAAILGAVAIGYYTLQRLDREPRTNDGYLFADRAGIAPDVSGRIVSLNVKENERVKKGDVLLQVDPEPFDLHLREARDQVAALRAQIDLTNRQVASQTSGADAAKTQIDHARAQLALASDTLARLTPLQTKGYVTDQQVDEARTSKRSAEVELEATIQQAEQAHQAIGDTASLQAQLAAAEAAVDLAARDVRNAILRAPFDGLVVGLEIAEGEYAVTGRPLFTLIKTDQWFAVGDFRETELRSIHIGDPATVWVMADDRQPLKGHVESLGWGVHPDSGGGPELPAVERTLNWVIVAQRFPVRVLLDDPPPDAMRIGETVSIVVRHDGAR
jgi:multidrug efflux system membrane fusion protein